VKDIEHFIRKPFAGKTEKIVLEEKQVTFDLIIITRFAPSSKFIQQSVSQSAFFGSATKS